MKPAIRAAIEVARQFGIKCNDPALIHETNNTVVWLRPWPVVAKVGTRSDVLETLSREFEVAAFLAAQGAPVARPWPSSVPTHHADTEYLVTLWERLEHDSGTEPLEAEVGESLKRVHSQLTASPVPLPSFRVAIGKAHYVLFNDARMHALPSADLVFLRQAFERLLTRLDGCEFREQPLHGEPHAGNYIATSIGIRWLDFENVCLGPLEWDLAYLNDEAREPFSFDHDLLELLRPLISACVATWCGIQARFPEMRAFGEEHLNKLRVAMEIA